jgi:hypothetical protein
MSSHILLATVTGIALSTPAWAHDPAEAPIDSDIEAILLDPAEAPIDTEMKILWLENIEALCGRTPQPCEPAYAAKPPPVPAPQSRNTSRHSRTQTLPRIRTLCRLPAEFRLEAAAGVAGPIAAARSILRSSTTCMSACRERARVPTNFMGAWLY